MIRFKEICLTESFKEKVNNYNIKNPYVQNFVLRYENLIDWGVVKTVKKSGDDVERNIQSQIKGIVDKFISQKLDVDNKKTIFSKENHINWEKEVDILKTESENGNIEATQALEQFKDNPKESKQQVLDSINEGKRKIFGEWSRYLRGNDVYRYNYAFQYIIFKSILDQDGSTRNPPTPVNASIVANLFEKIKQSATSPFNISKSYKNFYSDYLESKNEMIKGTGGEWMKIPSKSEDPEKYEQNIKDLMSMSYSSWCIRQDTFARKYLAGGAFWLYFVEDKKGNKYAEIAIRLSDNNVAEIRGATSDQSIPKESEPIIVEFLEKVEGVTGGQDFLNEYYRKKYDEKSKKYFKENCDELLAYYEHNMPSEYINDLTSMSQEEYDENENSKLLVWWKNGKTVDDGDPRQTKFEFESDPQFETVDDDFRFNSLLVGLAYNANILGFDGNKINTSDLGYNYVVVEDNISLEEFSEKTGDDLVSEYNNNNDNGYESHFSDINYGFYIDIIKEIDPDAFEKFENLLVDTDKTPEYILSNIGDNYVFYDAESDGHRVGYEVKLYETLRTQLHDAIDGFRIERTDGEQYLPDPDDQVYRVTILHENLIETILTDFDSITYEGKINWVDDWQNMSSVDYGDFDEEAAKEYFKSSWDSIVDYFDDVTQIYVDTFVDDFESNRVIDILSSGEYVEDVDGILVYGGNKYRPLAGEEDYVKSSDEDELKANLVQIIESQAYDISFIDDGINNIVLFNVDVPQTNMKWMGFYELDNNLKTSVDPKTMKQFNESSQYLNHF